MSAEPRLQAIRRHAWTSTMLVLCPPEAAAAASAELDRTLVEVDLVASRFRPDSEVSALAAAAPDTGGMVTARVSPVLADLLAAAERAWELSEQLVDPCLGGVALAARGELPPVAKGAGVPAPLRTDVRWSDVRFDRSERGLSLPAGTLLDLGATAKARTADVLAARLAELGGSALVNLGGDIAVAGDAPDGGWRVGLAGAVHGAPGSQVSLVDGAIATSSTLLRQWETPSGLSHHILDPRTGRSARTDWVQATVIAGTCTDANAAATAAIILGDQAPEHLERHGLPARLVAADGRVEVTSAWPVEHSRPRPGDLPALSALPALTPLPSQIPLSAGARS